MTTRTVVISGGTKGLGRYLAEAFLQDKSFNVSIFGRSRTSFIEEILEWSAIKDRFFFRETDISQPQDIKTFIEMTNRRFGLVNILINNAGIANAGVLALQQDQEIRRLIEINLLGTIQLTKLCVRDMLMEKWGRIINVTSIVGKTGFRGLSVYSITKAGLDGFSRSLARELGGRGITVNSVAPGFLETEMTHGLSDEQKQQIIRRTPAGRLGTPQDIAPLIQFLCSDEAKFISGQTIVVDGGLSA